MPKVFYLNQKHILAMQRRMEGVQYNAIAKEMDVSIDTVKNWFRKNGLLQKHYSEYAGILLKQFYKKNKITDLDKAAARIAVTNPKPPKAV